jgi:hypothetical protein
MPVGSRGGGRGNVQPEEMSLQEKLARTGAFLEQKRRAFANAKLNTPAYTKAEKEYLAAKKAFDELNAQSKAETAAALEKKNQAEVTRLQGERKRAITLGAKETDQKIKDIDAKIKALGGTPTPITGTAGQGKDSDGDGIPDLIDNLPTVANPDQKSGTGKVGSAGTAGVGSTGATGSTGSTGGTGTGTGNKDKVVIDKTVWVSYMRQTFKTLDDAKMRDQIEKLLDTAKKQNWDEATFMEALKGTTWWQTEYPTFRNFFLESNDPRNAATFGQKVNNKTDAVRQRLEALGIRLNQIDPTTGKMMTPEEYNKRVNGIILETIKNDWTDAQLDNYLATKSDIIFSGGGSIGSSIRRINDVAWKYGVNLDDNYKKSINQSLLDTMDGRDESFWYEEMKRQASDLYSPFSEGLNQGRTLYDMTRNYRTQMASLLEMDESSIKWNDLMKYAMKTGVDGKPAKSTFAEFTKSIKNDPLWQYTKNAKETYTNQALSLLRDFGIVG